MPEGVGLEDFVAAGGKIPAVAARPETITVRQLFDHYLKTHGNGTIEASSLGTARTHLNQVAESLGERFRIQSLTVIDLQEHVNRRAQPPDAELRRDRQAAAGDVHEGGRHLAERGHGQGGGARAEHGDRRRADEVAPERGRRAVGDLAEGHARVACASSATSLGVRATLTPAASSASAFAAAVPFEPVTIAPAWPMRLPGGASNPAM